MIDLNPVIDAAIRQRLITPQQALTLRPKITGSLLPLTTMDVTIPEDVWPLIFLELLAVAGLTERVPWQEAQARIAAMKIEELLKIHERLQDKFERSNWLLAVALLAGGTVANWQTGMIGSIRSLMLSQLALGAGKVPAALQLEMVRQRLKREADYLARFTLGIAVALAGGTSSPSAPGTEGAIANRADLYSGPARGFFYQSLEERLQDLTDEREGWVMQYISRDDDSTCQPCSDAAGYYLPGLGPMPGQICEGRGRCRCQRVPRYLPEIRERLLSERL